MHAPQLQYQQQQYQQQEVRMSAEQVRRVEVQRRVIGEWKELTKEPVQPPQMSAEQVQQFKAQQDLFVERFAGLTLQQSQSQSGQQWQSGQQSPRGDFRGAAFAEVPGSGSVSRVARPRSGDPAGHVVSKASTSRTRGL